ncbi:unnamed protein product [Ceutorhynchus assimilis]|uniref:Uncharacterized protein n=1 Tax=Ceutorhynchus assimilis TaxID=467358 RepID=A0A9N9QR76_9CUCU|nr:unnamed protein product [Ceutorhynchus assimilis]
MLCGICEKDNNEKTVQVTLKGLPSLVKASKIRGDATDIPGKPSVICLKNNCEKLVSDEWLKQRDSRNNTPEEERASILKAAAQILKEDIRGMVTNLNEYPSCDDIKTGGNSFFPNSLDVFFEELVLKGRKSSLYQTKVNEKLYYLFEEPNAENERLPVLLDTLWLTGKVLSFSSISWTGFMSTLESDSLNVDTSIIPLPFINLDPGNLNTIYTALSFAAEKSKRYEKSCIVTFDQPLFQKAVDIVEGSNKSDIVSSVIVRLGGFHTLMSFMGSVGKIMAGSGIEELLTTVYAKNTVPHMMSGHAYSRALRGHFLIHEALILIMLDDPEILSLSEEDIQNIHSLYNDTKLNVIKENGLLIEVQEKVYGRIDDLANTSRTGKFVKERTISKNLASMNSSIKLHNTYIDFNPMQLFNRIICSNKTPEEIKHCFKYELSPYPLSLFKDGNLRKGTKSQLLQELDKIYKPESMPHSDTVYVIDGGFLLHKVSWQKPASYNDIFLQYVNYVIHNYNKDCVIVFDGYTKEVISTKESLQRCRSKGSIEISIHAQASVIIPQVDFLKNSQNKTQFINILRTYFEDVGITVHQAPRDADYLITMTAVELSMIKKHVTVVSEDTDIMVLLIHHAKNKNISMLRPGKAAKGQHGQQGLKSTFNLATLPPTADSAEQHVLRTYFQIQEWIGNNLDPLQYGWKKNKQGNLIPVQCKEAVVPLIY